MRLPYCINYVYYSYIAAICAVYMRQTMALHDQRHRNDPERTSRKRPERGYYVTLDDPLKV